MKTFEDFLNEKENSIKASNLVSILNDAAKRKENVTVVVKGKTYVLSGFLYQNYKTIEVKVANTGQTIKFKNDDSVLIKESLNEAVSYQNIAKELVGIAAYYTDADLSSEMTNAVKCDDAAKVTEFFSNLKDMMKDEEPGKIKEFENQASDFLAKNKIDESKVNESSEIVLQKLSDIDHTRVIKWLAATFNNNDYEIRKKGSTDYVIDTKKLDNKSISDLKNYLKSQDYIKESVNEGSNDNLENYMFFGNLKTIKNHVDKLLMMDPATVDAILKDGHSWAVDHVATSKDDIEEVGNFLKNEIQEKGTGAIPSENK
jgi:hypothetical protein